MTADLAAIIAKRRDYVVAVENAILNRWASGQSTSRIRHDLNLGRNRVTLVVCAARARGDFRAIHHAAQDGQIIGRYRNRPPQSDDRGLRG